MRSNHVRKFWYLLIHNFFLGTICTIVPFHRTTEFRPSYQKVKIHRTSFCPQVFVVMSVFDDLCGDWKLRLSAFQRRKNHQKQRSPRRAMNHSCRSLSSHCLQYICYFLKMFMSIPKCHRTISSYHKISAIVPKCTKVWKSIVPCQKTKKNDFVITFFFVIFSFFWICSF